MTIKDKLSAWMAGQQREAKTSPRPTLDQLLNAPGTTAIKKQIATVRERAEREERAIRGRKRAAKGTTKPTTAPLSRTRLIKG